MSTLSGVLPILPTIFTASGAIDKTGTRRVLEYVIDSGASGVVFPGLASEYDTLAQDERLDLTREVGQWNDGRIDFVVGASASNLNDAAKYAIAGAEVGAVSAMILTPKEHANDLDAMAGYFQDIYHKSGLPVMLQNAPAPMGIGMSLDKVAELVEKVKGIEYVKEEAAPSGQRITQLTDLAGNHLTAVFGGAGARYLMDELTRGAKGTMPACEITQLHVQMYSKFIVGDTEEARNLFERTLPLLSMQANFRWRLTKAVLKLRGLINDEYTRAPGPELDKFDRLELNALLNRMRDLFPLP